MNQQYIKNPINAAKHLYFIGIGGISMSAIALYCIDRGYCVSGSDRTESRATAVLREKGADIYIGHDAQNIKGADAVIYTGAVDMTNPELSAAAGAGIPVYSRAEALGLIMLPYETRIGVAGTHGKSTVTAMTAHIMSACGLDPTVMCGAESKELGGAYKNGSGKYFVFEACEYKEAFLSFYPTVSVVLNIDLDHTDYYKSLDDLKEAFRKYSALPFAGRGDGLCIVCGDDRNALEATAGCKSRVTFGTESPECDIYATDINMNKGFSGFTAVREGEREHVSLSVPGRHNIRNALAAIAASMAAGVGFGDACKAVGSFSGIKRRFEFVGKTANSAYVYIDYAHHPREIKAVVETALGMTEGKLICIFEPHTYSRTEALFDEFTKAFEGSSQVIFTDIYAAREINTSGVSSERLASKTPGGIYAGTYGKAAELALGNTCEGDMILVLGAGTVNTVAEILVNRIKNA